MNKNKRFDYEMNNDDKNEYCGDNFHKIAFQFSFFF